MKNLKPAYLAAAVGAATGAVVTTGILVVLVLFGNLNGGRTVDVLSFALIVVGIVITALTVLGAFTLVNTWNDIDARTHTIVNKYEHEAKAEIARNAEERQRAINETGDKMIAMGKTITANLLRRNAIFVVLYLAMLMGYSALSLFLQYRSRNHD